MGGLLHKSRRFWNLPVGTKMTLLQAWGLLLVVEARLRTQDFRRTLRWASALRPVPHSGSPLERALSVRDLVAMAARHQLWEMTCLRQALAACRILSRQGIPSQLRLGVRQREGQVEAHAWLEVEGQTVPILGAGDRDYSELRRSV